MEKETVLTCTDCNWQGSEDELLLKTYPNGGDDTVCPKCESKNVEEMETKKDWSEPDAEGMIDVPDELMPLFNKVGMQFRFFQFSGKSDVLCIAHIIQLSQEFFKKNPELLNT